MIPITLDNERLQALERQAEAAYAAGETTMPVDLVTLLDLVGELHQGRTSYDILNEQVEHLARVILNRATWRLPGAAAPKCRWGCQLTPETIRRAEGQVMTVWYHESSCPVFHAQQILGEGMGQHEEQQFG